MYGDLHAASFYLQHEIERYSWERFGSYSLKMQIVVPNHLGKFYFEELWRALKQTLLDIATYNFDHYYWATIDF